MTIKNQTLQIQPADEVSAARQLKRDFTAATDATSLILRRIGFPLKRRRNIVCALQGIGHGRAVFECSHLNLARRLQHEGRKAAAEMCAYRELKALIEFQHRSGYELFGIVHGGGIERRRTTYTDFITPAAVWAVREARRDEQWKANPGLTLQSKIEAALNLLPRSEPAREQKNGERRNLPAATSTTTDQSIARHHLHSIKHLRACAALVAGTLEHNRLVIDRYESLINDISALAREAKTKFKQSSIPLLSSATKLSDLSSPPPRPPQRGDEDVVRPSGEKEEGLPISSPSDATCGEDPIMPRMLDAAINYASRGWAVFPVHNPNHLGHCSCRKGSICRDAGKHPRTKHGVRDATGDEKIIIDWWRRWPEANVGLAMGEASGMVCLDIDPRHGGDKSLRELIERHGELPATARVETGGGGAHIFFALPGAPCGNSSGVLGPGIDVKTTGGYVVAAPSLHASGRRYRWTSELDPASMPDWLLSLPSLLARASTPKARPSNSVTKPEQARISPGDRTGWKVIVEGSRNERLYRIGCAMRGRGEGLVEIRRELQHVNAQQCLPPLDEAEVTKIAASAAKRQPNAHHAETPQYAPPAPVQPQSSPHPVGW